MYECKVCNKSLYSKITFTNIFNLEYEIHSECVDRLQKNELDILIPIDENYVIYDYVNKSHICFLFVVNVWITFQTFAGNENSA